MDPNDIKWTGSDRAETITGAYDDYIIMISGHHHGYGSTWIISEITSSYLLCSYQVEEPTAYRFDDSLEQALKYINIHREEKV